MFNFIKNYFIFSVINKNNQIYQMMKLNHNIHLYHAIIYLYQYHLLTYLINHIHLFFQFLYHQNKMSSLILKKQQVHQEYIKVYFKNLNTKLIIQLFNFQVCHHLFQYHQYQILNLNQFKKAYFLKIMVFQLKFQYMLNMDQ